MSSTGYGPGQLAEVYGLAVDTNGDIWMTNEQAPGTAPRRAAW